MDDQRRTNGPERGTEHDDERAVEKLLRGAGPRAELPEDDLEAIVAAGRAVWRERVEERTAARRRRRWPAVAGMAAGLAVALGIAWWWSAVGGRPGDPEPSDGPGAPVATVIAAWDAPEPWEGRELAVGTVVETGIGGGPLPGRLALRLGTGTGLRLDRTTRLRLVSASVVELEGGAVYVDTGTRDGDRDGGHLTVRTPFGTARDVGTRFLVELGASGDPGRSGGDLTVRVREGRVELERGGEVHRAGGGEAVVVRSDGTVERRSVPGHGAAWDWVVATAPTFPLEGSTLTELLVWVSRETGWRVRYVGPELAASADGIVLHGSLHGLRPDQAPFAVLPGAGLEGELEDGVLVVRRAPAP